MGMQQNFGLLFIDLCSRASAAAAHCCCVLFESERKELLPLCPLSDLESNREQLEGKIIIAAALSEVQTC